MLAPIISGPIAWEPKWSFIQPDIPEHQGFDGLMDAAAQLAQPLRTDASWAAELLLGVALWLAEARTRQPTPRLPPRRARSRVANYLAGARKAVLLQHPLSCFQAGAPVGCSPESKDPIEGCVDLR